MDEAAGRRGSMLALLRKEVRLLTRSRMAFWGLALVLILVGGIVCMFWADGAQRATLNARADFGRSVFAAIASMLLLALGILSPVLGAVAFTDERERKTYDMLASAGFSHRAMIFGKWLAAIFYQLLLVICLAPILMVMLQLGGVEPKQFAAAGYVIVMTATTFAMIGVALSANLRSSMRATMLAILFFIMMTMGVYILLLFVLNWMNVGSDDDLIYLIAAVSPYPAHLLAVVPDLPLPISAKATNFIFGLSYALFIVAAYLVARFGLKRGDARRGLGPGRLIDDPKLLRKRRLSFPFYLIDPLRRAQKIPDGRDALLVRELRSGSSRLETVIRLVYCGAALTVLTGLGYGYRNSALDNMHRAAWFAVCFCFLFLPLMAATAITRERETGTYDLLRTLPVTSGRVVRAKWKASFKLIVVLFAGVMLWPIAAGLIFEGEPWEHMIALAKVIPWAVSYLALYTAVGIACSAHARRNMGALVLAFALCAGLFLMPVVVVGIYEDWWAWVLYDANDQFVDLPILLRASLAAISPMLAMENPADSNDYNMFGFSERWPGLFIQFALTLGLTWWLLRFAAWRMDKNRE